MRLQHGSRLVVTTLMTLSIVLGLVSVLTRVQEASAAPAVRPLADTWTFGQGACVTSIQNCLTNVAADGDSIVIPAGIYTENLVLTKSVSLSGALSSTTILRAAITGTAVLYISGGNITNSVVISGLTIADGDAGNTPGGGIAVRDEATPTLQHLILRNNKSDANGGGMFIQAGSSGIKLSHLQFISNSTAAFGGGLNIELGNLVSLANSQFLSNSAELGGGGLFAAGFVTLTNPYFAYNTTTGNGGGMFVGTGARINNGQFLSNTAVSGGGGIYGGSLLTLAPMLIDGSRFEFNTTTGLGNGGAIALNANMLTQITATQFSNNQARDGGAVSSSGALTFTSAYFERNRASLRGGAVYGLSSLYVVSTTVITNSALIQAGGLQGGNGTRIIASVLRNNRCNDDGCRGGGVYGEANLTLNDTQIISHSAGLGGGVYANSSLTLNNTSIMSNVAALSGGGVYVAEGVAQLTNSRIVNNSCDGSLSCEGGGLWSGATLALSQMQFISNTAGLGGGLYHFSETMRVTNTLFARNATFGIGASLYLTNVADARMVHTTIASPTLVNQAAIAFESSTLSVTNSIMVNHAFAISNTGGILNEDYNLFNGNSVNLQGAFSSGGHSLDENPAFVNAANDDYHLSATSEAIDIGAPLGVSSDFDGDPRPRGFGIDVGYDESPYSAYSDLYISKAVTPLALYAGQPLTYTLVYTNLGNRAARSGISITDLIPSQLYSVTYTSSGAPITATGASSYTWSVAPLAPNAGGVITVSGRVTTSIINATRFTNTATITTSRDVTPTNNSASVGVDVLLPQVAFSGAAYAVRENAGSALITVTIAPSSVNTTSVAYTTSNGTASAGSDYTATVGVLTFAAGATLQTFSVPIINDTTLEASETLTLTLSAPAGLSLGAPGVAILTILDDENLAPTANAGADITASVNAQVNLNGSGNDPDNHTPLTYGWQQVGGPAVVLNGATSANASFSAPATPANLTFALVVTDALGSFSAPDTVVVSVLDAAISGLSASNSSPSTLGSVTFFTATIAAGTNVTYQWNFGDSMVVAASAAVTHTYAAPGFYTAVVTATNSQTNVAASTAVTVTRPVYLPLVVR